jgi:hypothetical protein
MKPVRELFWVDEYRPLTTVSMDAETGIPLRTRATDPLRKYLPGLLKVMYTAT